MDYHSHKIFKINGKPFVVHDFVLKKASIFEVLNDVKDDESNIVIPNTPHDDVTLLLTLLYSHNNK